MEDDDARNDRLADFLRRHPVVEELLRKHPHPLGDLGKDYPWREVETIQSTMVDSASHFLESQREALEVVVRLTVEFFHYLRRVDIDSVDSESLMYINSSTFVGVEFFPSLCSAYSVTQGETRSTLPQRVISRAALKEEFITMYHAFAAEILFERKCRLLIDLFKLQIIFAGMTYD